MSIEKTDRIDPLLSSTKAILPTTASDQSSGRIAEDSGDDRILSTAELRLLNRTEQPPQETEDSGDDRFLSSGELRLVNETERRVQGGVDLDDHDFDLDKARVFANEVAKMLSGRRGKSTENYDRFVEDLKKSLSLNRAEAEELLHKVEGDSDLSPLA